MAELGKTRLVIAPSLRGFGDSGKPACCYDKKSLALQHEVKALVERAVETRTMSEARRLSEQ